MQFCFSNKYVLFSKENLFLSFPSTHFWCEKVVETLWTGNATAVSFSTDRKVVHRVNLSEALCGFQYMGRERQSWDLVFISTSVFKYHQWSLLDLWCQIQQVSSFERISKAFSPPYTVVVWEQLPVLWIFDFSFSFMHLVFLRMSLVRCIIHVWPGFVCFWWKWKSSDTPHI